ncbi:MAG: DUF2189 domain-containing protein [Burkholderiales bacterium]|nr:DUF2189 domain-containing protein [Burkholderiales bacterium]
MTDEDGVTEPGRTGEGGSGQDSPFPAVRAIGMDAPARWLRAGWRDLRAAPVPSLFYGVVLAAMGFALAHAPGSGAIELALVTGFLLVGPFLLMGLYDIAQRVARGEDVMIGPTMTAWKANVQSIGFYAIILALLLAVWIRISIVVVALFFEGAAPSVAALAADAVRNPETLTFVAAYAAAGCGFALFVFATSVVSLPMLYDRPQMDTLTAMITSFNALRRNFWPMLAWAATIVALTALGFATYYVGLVVALPLVGLATWHAYRDVVAPDGARSEETPT